jgi:hypothetical protein
MYDSPALSKIKIPGGSIAGVTNVPRDSPSSGAKAAITNMTEMLTKSAFAEKVT